MAQLAGKSGYISLGIINYAFSSWTGNITSDTLDTTNFDSAGFKENIAGLTSMRISARGPFDSTAMALTAGSSYAFVLAMSATVNISCEARVESINITTDVTRPVEVDISAMSTGTFTAAIV